MDLPFGERVYAVARRIPRGSVATYGQIAALAGRPRAARAVGGFMSRCPDGNGVPCHRVIRGDGLICGEFVFGISGLQRQLLLSEGVVFCADGRVNMKECLWKPEAERLPKDAESFRT